MKVTEQMRQDILRVYKDEGSASAAAFCAKLGLSRGYYSALACRRGVADKKSKPLTDDQKLVCWSRATCDADVEHKTEHQCLMDYGIAIEAAHDIK